MSSSPYGIYGNDVAIEDVLLLLRELSAKSDDAINQFERVVTRMEQHRINSPTGSSKDEPDTMPIWLQYPISLHDRLSRWLARHERSQEISIRTSVVLNGALLGVGKQLSDLSGRLLTFKEHQSRLREKSLNSKSNDKAYLALGLRERRSEDVDRPSYEVDYKGAYNNWSNQDFQKEYRHSLTQGLIDLKEEIENLKSVSFKVEEEINGHQALIDETESSITKIQAITVKVNEVMRKTRRLRLKWLPIGATLGGVSLGMIAGSPAGVVGLAVGGVLGGATAGSAVTFVMEE